MNEYRESILLELKERSVVEHNMFLNAKYHFENENHLYLKLDDTIVAQGKQDSIVGLLNEVFEERCHVPIQIHVEYQQAKTSKMQEHECPYASARRSMRLWKRMQQNLRQKKRRRGKTRKERTQGDSENICKSSGKKRCQRRKSFIARLRDRTIRI